MVHPQGDVRRLLEETRAGRWADVDDPEAIRTMLLETVEDAGPQLQPDYSRIAAYHRRPLATRYAGLLKGLVQAASSERKETDLSLRGAS
jgi:hypothetical protein